MSTQSSKLALGLSWARSIFVLDPLIWLYTVILGTLSLLSSLFDRKGRVQHGFARLWSWLILHTIFSPVQVSGMERVDASRSHVLVANHLSALDIPVLYVHLPFQFRILAKRELFRYPFMGWHLRRSGQIPVDIDDNEKSSITKDTYKRALKTLHAGMPLMVFPEGGRSATGQVQPFMRGAFLFAARAKVEVVPMAIVGTYEILPMNSFQIRPGRIELLVGEPISTAGYDARNVEVLASRVQQAVEDLYYSRSRVADPRKEEKSQPQIHAD